MSVIRASVIRAEDVRIPRSARDAVARHETVMVMNRERPAYLIVHPDDHGTQALPPRQGRRLDEALVLLGQATLPDPDFGQDMATVLESVGPAPDDPWAPS